MMHYGSWLDGVGAENRYYDNGYGALPSMMYANVAREEEEPRRQDGQGRCEEDAEQTGDETHETGTSCERSTSADIFRLEFAASQWSRLVTNAEGLFTKLMTKNLLPDNEQDQIEQWLCLKQEYEECIGSGDESAQGCAGRRSLERIEEVTETDESGNPGKARSGESSEASEEEEEDDEEDEEEDEEEEEEDEEDAGSENPDFLEKLDDLMRKFKEDTDRMIEANKYEFQAAANPPRIVQDGKNNNGYVPIVKPIPIRNPNSRRNSMLPGSEPCNEVVTFNGNFQRVQRAAPESRAGEPDVLVDALRSLEIPEPVKALKNLTANNVAKQSLVRKIQDDLETAQRRIVELQSTIRAKERFIEDMNRNSEVRMSAKEKFQLRRNRLEEEYYNTRSQLAQAENASLRDCAGERGEEGRREIERYRTMAINYEKRLVDIEMIKRIAGDSARKVLELESSLNASRKQMEKLKRQLRREEERKRQLERELADDQSRIRELEDKYNLTASKLREIRDSQEDHHQEERHQDAHHHNHQEDHEKKNLLEVSARISHLDQVLKEKSMNLERVTDTDEKEALRHEIRNLRRTRECLIEEKCGLDEKLQKERTLSILEERKLLECGETIEAIDAMIEHKNEMICGRGDLEIERSQREKSERMLSQLEKLSDGEMRTLFDKYFWKVIDLKQSSKNLEIQAAELERHVELQDKRVRALTEALQRTKLEAERRVVDLQREQHERIHLMFRHIAEETGASSSHEVVDRNLELARFKRENKTLRRRLADVEALLKPNANGAGPTPKKNHNGPPHIVQQELKKITPKTKVTRERNKLIIQQTVDSDKRKK